MLLKHALLIQGSWIRFGYPVPWSLGFFVWLTEAVREIISAVFYAVIIPALNRGIPSWTIGFLSFVSGVSLAEWAQGIGRLEYPNDRYLFLDSTE
jgi:hypothetical protein